MAKIEIEKILANPEQPRRLFDERELEELAQSIRENGVIQPVVVEESEGGFYILHDGERRTRAARMAGLEEVEAVVMPPLNGDGPQKRLVRAMVANLQRSDLSHIEEAEGYARLMKLGMSVGEISQQTGKAQTVIYTKMDWLKMEPEIQKLVHEGKLSGQRELCKALMDIPDSQARVALAVKAAERKLSAKTIITAASALARGKEKRYQGTPALEEVRERRGGRPVNEMKWDAMAQAGVVPPWPAVRMAAVRTCQGCLLASAASWEVCKECPAPQMLLLLVEAVEGAR